MRASSASSASKRRAALTSSRAASPTRRWSNAISPRSCSISAACSASTGPASTATSSSSAASSAPASRFARAAASRRRARRARLGRERRRVLEEGGGGRDAPARQRAAGRALELLGDLLVRRGRRLGAVPGAPVGIELRVGGLRQRGVQRVPFLRRRRAVGRRAHARVPEPHLRADLEQPGVDGGRRGLRIDAEPLGRSPHEQRLADGIGRRELQQPPRVGGQRVEPPPEALLDAGLRHRAGPAEAARQLRRAHAPRQLEQGQRVAARLRDDPLADALVEPAGDDRRQQGARVLVVEPFQPQLRQARRAGARRSARGRRTRSRPARRAAGAPRTRAPAPEASSSHWRSSTRHSSGCSSATSASRLSVARPTRKRSGAAPDARPSATRSASCCGAGSASSRPSSGAQSWCSPANGSSISDSTPETWATRNPDAWSAA